MIKLIIYLAVSFVLISVLNFFLFLAFYIYMHKEYSKDLTSEKRFSEILDKTFELKQDVFVHQFNDSNKFHLMGPPFPSFLPASIEDYLNDKINWPLTDSNAKKGMGLNNHYLKCIVKGIVKKGTLFKITRIYSTYSPGSGRSLSFVAKIKNDDFYLYNIEIDGYSLISNYFDVIHDENLRLEINNKFVADNTDKL